MRRDRSIALVVFVLVVGLLVGFVVSRRDGDVHHDVKLASQRFLDRYVDADGRVVRRDQGGDTVSEGQAYAMLVSVAVGDRNRFDAVWNWTKANLLQPNGLLAWRWADGRVVDVNGATDADMDAARALSLAATKFEEGRYGDEAKALSTAITDLEIVYDAQGSPILVGGPWATNEPYFVNPSYNSPRAAAELSTLTGDKRWPQVVIRQRQMVVDLMGRLDHTNLPPDWAVLQKSGSVAPVGTPSNPAQPAMYSYDAFRTPIRLAESCDPTDRQLAARMWPLLGRDENTRASVQMSLDGSLLNDQKSPLGYVAAAAAAKAANRTDDVSGLLRSASHLDDENATYYGAAWIALGRIMLETNLLGSCSR